MQPRTTGTLPSRERIDHLHVGFLKVADVAGGDGKSMHERGCCNEAVLEGHLLADCAKLGEQLCPADAGRSVEGETSEILDPFVEPIFEALSASAARHSFDTEANFAEDDRVHHDLAFVAAKPVQDFRLRCRLCGLAEHIRIDGYVIEISEA
jgi:hypothetical protein